MSALTAGDAKKILFVDHSGLPGGGQLGLERYILASTLSRKSVLFFAGGPIADRLRARSIEVEQLSDLPGKWAYFLLLPEVIFKLRRMKPDVTVANSNRAASLLAFVPRKLTGTRLFYLRDDLNPERLSRARHAFFARFVVRRFDAFISNSEWTRSTIPDGVAHKRSFVAYPVSGASSESAGVGTAEGNDSPLTILWLSRIARWKGIGVLLEALRLLEGRGLEREFRVTIAGGAEFEDAQFAHEIRQGFDGLSMQVDFVGHVQNVSKLLEASDVLVSASVTPEPFGQVIVQGMAHGLAVVSSAHGGPLEIIQNEVTGVLVPPGDATALADTLSKLAEAPDLRRMLGENARVAAERFSDDNTVAQLDRILRSIGETTVGTSA